jgi:acetylornithine deacetylase/succinyl-diaminopimelate desuccinylase-like protein
MSTESPAPKTAADLDPGEVKLLCHRTWEDSIVPALVDYVRIPAKSPHFDADWAENGHIDAAVALIERWCRAQPIPGLTVEVVRLDGRTPLIYMEVPGTGDDTVLLYGHLDKQPEMVGWRDDLGPWSPVLEDDKLYGRGGADDGYAAFASLTAIRALHEQGVPHARCVILIEGCEESGSYDLPHYVEHLRPRIGEPSLVVCLDSGCGDYERLWATTSLRGMALGTLRVEILEEGVHSGDASGIVPDSFRIARALVSRLEDEATGRVLPDELHVTIPDERREQARAAADVLGDAVWRRFPFAGDATGVGDDGAEQVLARTWRPALSITGAEGLPPLADAGNVLRPATVLKLSLRLPPTLDAARATEVVKRVLEADPPYGARVTYEPDEPCDGWDAPAISPWLEEALHDVSRVHFGQPAALMGEGGTIPFMGMLGELFPAAQFVITGVLGPGANAHGPNEFLHIPTGKRVTACVSGILARHFEVGRQG